MYEIKFCLCLVFIWTQSHKLEQEFEELLLYNGLNSQNRIFHIKTKDENPFHVFYLV